MSLALAHERRLYPRRAVTKPCKLRDPLRLSFAAGVTHDVSPRGVRVEVRRERPYAVGDRIDVGVQWAEAGVLSAGSLAPGVVRRIDHAEPGRQIIAIEIAPSTPAVAAA